MEYNREVSVAFTGHQEYDGQADDRLAALVRSLYEEGYRFFYSGMALGFDLAAAEAVLSLREECPGMQLIAVVPFHGQERDFPIRERMRYWAVLAAADRTVELEPAYRRGCFYRRTDYLVDHADRLVAWYERSRSGTGYTVRRARKERIEVTNLFEEVSMPMLFTVW